MPRSRVPVREVLAEVYRNIGGDNETPGLSNLRGFFTVHQHDINYVLVYYGSFNPPHNGHLSALEAGLAVGTFLDFEFKTTLVSPGISERVSIKYRNRREGTQVFSMHQRCMLWVSDPRFPLGRAWVWGQDFNAELVQTAKSKFGVNIEIISLLGEDLVVEDPPKLSFPQKMTYSKIVVQRGEHNNLLKDAGGTTAVWKHAKKKVPMDWIGYNGTGAIWKSRPGFFTHGHFFCYVENQELGKSYSSSELNRLLKIAKNENIEANRTKIINYALSGEYLLSYCMPGQFGHRAVPTTATTTGRHRVTSSTVLLLLVVYLLLRFI